MRKNVYVHSNMPKNRDVLHLYKNYKFVEYVTDRPLQSKNIQWASFGPSIVAQMDLSFGIQV